MRYTVIVSAIVILIASVLFLGLALGDSVYFRASFFGFGLGGLNLFLGVIIPMGGGVTIPEKSQGPVKLSVDKAVIGSSIYNMTFTEKKIVLKKLSSGRLTILTALLLAVIGYSVAGLIGAVEAGLTAFSLQEFVTQRRRSALTEEDVLNATKDGDLEFQYSSLDKVELTRNRLRLYLNDRILRIVISRKYPDKMRTPLERIISSTK